MQVSTAKQMEAKPAANGCRRLAGVRPEQRRTDVHDAATLQNARETVDGSERTRSSPGVRRWRRRGRGRSVAPASGRLPVAGRGEEGPSGGDSGRPSSIPSTERILAARRSSRDAQTGSGRLGMAGRGGCCRPGFRPSCGRRRGEGQRARERIGTRE
jgi:hypothetical protein